MTTRVSWVSNRLVDVYEIGAIVEVKLADREWLRAVVVAHQHPGIWVVDGARQAWFVTNTRNIKRLSHDA